MNVYRLHRYIPLMSRIDEEFYTVDISACGTMIAYGGKGDTLLLSSFPELMPIAQASDLSDSVIFVKFLKPEILLCVTLDGCISLYFYDNGLFTEAENIDVEEDISYCEINGDLLFIGTEKGTVHVFSLDLKHEQMFVGQSGEIRWIRVYREQLYVLSSIKLVIFDMKTEEVVFKRVVNDFRTIEVLNDFLIFLGGESESILIKDRLEVIKKFNFGSESTLMTEDYLAVGGSGFSLNVFVRKNPSNSYNIKFLSEKVTGISKIFHLHKHEVIFSTFCGRIGIGDLRSRESFKFHEGDVGTIYDFKFHKNIVICVGEHGIRAIKINQ